MADRNSWRSIRWWSWGKVALLVSWAGVAALAFYWGRCGGLSRATAAPADPPAAAPAEKPAAPPAAPAGNSDYEREAVAYIYGVIPITRAELGEYLIARQGADRLDLLINRRIIEHACQEKGIEVTAAEVDAALADDLNGLHINKLDLVKNVLKRYSKTLYEWKEDVIRPRLMLAKLCKDRVTVTDDDLRQGFEAYYGEKAVVRMIMWPLDQKNRVLATYAKLRDDPAEFDRMSRQQASPTLAGKAGLLDPIGRHTMGNDDLEKAIFKLKPDELSEVKETPQGIVVFKCVRHDPPNPTKKLADVQPALEKEIRERKTALTIPVVFEELRKAAEPHKFLKGYKTMAEVEQEVQAELSASEKAQAKPAPTPPPAGN
jgi:hypothetical protein